MGFKERYKLVYHYRKGGSHEFSYDMGNGKVRDRFYLTEIDVFTSNFADDEELSRGLNLLSNVYNDGYFTIEYRTNGVLKTMELVFKDMPFVRKLALDNIRKATLAKKDITFYMREFLRDINKDPSFLKFIFEKRYTNSFFRNALNYYLTLKNSDDKDAQGALWQAEASLCREFCRYKTIRGLEIGRRNYELIKQNKNVPSFPNAISVSERARIEYELNHQKKKKKSDIVSNQMPLFDASEYTDESLKKGRTRR